MCHLTYLGTDSPEDLTSFNTAGFHLAKAAPTPDISEALSYPYIWLASEKPECCSCIFRTAMGLTEFGIPEDWLEEEQESLDASKKFYRVIAHLLAQGAKVESITCWEDQEGAFNNLLVDLSAVAEDEFRFFSGYRFDYCLTKKI